MNTPNTVVGNSNIVNDLYPRVAESLPPMTKIYCHALRPAVPSIYPILSPGTISCRLVQAE